MSTSNTRLIWLNADLRLDDNPLWQTALAETPDHLLVVYVLPATIFQVFGDVPLGATALQPLSEGRLRFLLESLTSLRAQLVDIGSDLLIVQGEASRLIPALARRHHCRSVITSRATGVMEQRQQQLVAAECSLQQVHSGLLLSEHELPCELDALPETFSAFRRRVEKTYPTAQDLPAPLPPIDQLTEWPPFAERGFQGDARQLLNASHWQSDIRGEFNFHGGEPAALDRITHYFQASHAGQYKTTRNRLTGADFSTRLSSWLAHGCVSPRRIMSELHTFQNALTHESESYRKESDWIRVELLWREYFHWDARRQGAGLFYKGTPHSDDETPTSSMNLPEPLPGAFDDWRNGTTGVPWVDAGMRELAATGWLSNRMRQNVASYLIKDLHVDWRLGAEWFEHCLIDHDVAANWGNWRYLAGVGRDPRSDRYFNMMKQARQHDPRGEYVTRWIPALEHLPAGMQRHAPWLSMQWSTGLSEYPRKPLECPAAWQAHLSDITPIRVSPWSFGSFERG